MSEVLLGKLQPPHLCHVAAGTDLAVFKHNLDQLARNTFLETKWRNGGRTYHYLFLLTPSCLLPLTPLSDIHMKKAEALA